MSFYRSLVFCTFVKVCKIFIYPYIICLIVGLNISNSDALFLLILVSILVLDGFKHGFVNLQSYSIYKFNIRDLIVVLSVLFCSFIITLMITGVSYLYWNVQPIMSKYAPY